MNPERIQAMLERNPLAAICALLVAAVIALFLLLVRSYSKRIDAAELQSTALGKMQNLHERTVEILEDVRVLKQARAKRKLAKEAAGEPVI